MTTYRYGYLAVTRRSKSKISCIIVDAAVVAPQILHNDKIACLIYKMTTYHYGYLAVTS
jgi:hypothetical protein